VNGESGLTIIDVMIAFALFIVIAMPVAYLITQSAGVTGQQRAKAIATQLASQVAKYGPSSTQTTSVSGIEFTTSMGCSQASTTITYGHPPQQASVPTGKEDVTVSWGASHSIQLVRWVPECPS
jgi:Tfp pilus assembly protein PilV